MVESQRAAELALVQAQRHARERVREDLVAAQLRAEREVARLSTADLQPKVQAELQAALRAKDSVVQAQLEREIANAARAGTAHALDLAREASEKAREEVRQRLQGLEIY